MAVKVEFKPVGRSGQEWIWKARDESNTISISGQRFDSLSDAVRDARIRSTVSTLPTPTTTVRSRPEPRPLTRSQSRVNSPKCWQICPRTGAPLLE